MRVFALALTVLALASLAFADIPGGPIYYHTSSKLYVYDPSTGSDTFIGNLGVSNMVDCAFDKDGKLYGVTGGGGFYRISTGTGAATLVTTTNVPGNLYAMGMHSAGNFYAAQWGTGDFYNLALSGGTITATKLGTYNDVDSQFTDTSGNPVTTLYPRGDIWEATDGTIFATVCDPGHTKEWLVTVDLTSTPKAAEVDCLAELTKTFWWAIAGSDDVSPGLVYLLDGSGKTYTWDGTNLSDTGYSTSGAYGASAIPAPGALVLGAMGVAMVAWLKRRMR